MGESRAEVRMIGKIVAQLVARKPPIGQNKYLFAICLARFSPHRTDVEPEGFSYSLFLD
jgi:hypothetical protein